MRDFNRESFFEELKERLTEMSEVCLEHDVPNFETYSLEDDEIEDEDIKRLIEILKDAHDVVERNI
jgi:hypothetical protein